MTQRVDVAAFGKAQKIMEIVHLAGVLPGDFQEATRNYFGLPEDELDQRLERLRGAAGTVAAWRAGRRPAGGAIEPLPGPSVGAAPDAGGMRQGKIHEIMRLAGVMPGDFARAARNYADLPESELDARLERLRNADGVVRAWRAGRAARAAGGAAEARAGMEVAAVAEPDSIAGPAPLVTSALAGLEQANAAVGRDVSALQTLLARLQRLYPPISEKLATDIGEHIHKLASYTERACGMEQPLGHFLQEITRRAAHDRESVVLAQQGLLSAAASNLFLASMTKYFKRNVEAAVNHPVKDGDDPVLQPFETVEALARLENDVLRDPPSLIVAMNCAGWSIARIVLHDLGMTDVPIVKFRGVAESGIFYDDARKIAATNGNVRVFGHVTRTGETLLKAIQQIRAINHVQKVSGAVLATTIDAAEKFSGDTLLVYHVLGSSGSINPGFDATEEVDVQSDHYQLKRAGADGDAPLVVTREELRQARVTVAERFPHSETAQGAA